MKNILFYCFLAIVATCIGVSWDKPEYDASVGESQIYNFRKDTTTNAEKDTIPLGKPNVNNIVDR